MRFILRPITIILLRTHSIAAKNILVREKNIFPKIVSNTLVHHGLKKVQPPISIKKVQPPISIIVLRHEQLVLCTDGIVEYSIIV